MFIIIHTLVAHPPQIPDSPLLTSASVLLKLRKILKLKYKNISYLTYVNFTLKHLGSSVK